MAFGLRGLRDSGSSGSRLIVNATLDFLLPPRCPACESRVDIQHALCAECWAKTTFFEKPWCDRLGTPFSYDVGEEAWSPRAIAAPPVYGRLRSVAAHTGAARRLVHGLKFAGRRDLAKPMGAWMVRTGKELLSANSLIVPVPLHWTRLVTRRFNQAADLAKVVAYECGGRFEPALLKRRRHTRNQVGLSAGDRRKNVRGAFRINPDRVAVISGQHVVLVDDVVTTGSTISACSTLLLKAGAASVDVLTFTHADVSAGSL